MDVSSSPAVTPVSQSITPCNVSLCGKVIAISNDGRQVAVSDDISPTPQVYIYNSAVASGTNPVTDLVLPGTGGAGSPDVASSAAFSSDLSKLFHPDKCRKDVRVYLTVDALAQVTIPASGTAVAFFRRRQLRLPYRHVRRAAGSVSAFSTCSTPGVPSTELGSVATAGVPLQIFALPNLPANSSSETTQNVFVLEPPNLQIFTAQFTQTPLSDTQFTCIPPTLSSFTAGPTFNLGQGAFTLF